MDLVSQKIRPVWVYRTRVPIQITIQKVQASMQKPELLWVNERA